MKGFTDMYQSNERELCLDDVLNEMNEKWYCTTKITQKNIMPFESKNDIETDVFELRKRIEGNERIFFQIVNYCHAITYYSEGYDHEGRLDFLENEKYQESIEEFHEWGEMGQLCAYVSSLLFALLTKYGVVDKKFLEYQQGYMTYKFPEHEDMPVIIYSGEVIMPHAFLTIGGNVIDPTALQINKYFIFTNYYFSTIGRTFTGISLVSRPEDKKTPLRYCMKAAKRKKLGPETWLDKHYQLAKDFPMDMMYFDLDQ